ncbi:MAG: NAD(P)/FAD-dependent oxidoreductase [Anaerolineae bacterium]|nr:NAD(P)/FAD-dependent oxidoreductase [Anaerolineae bacterium]
MADKTLIIIGAGIGGLSAGCYAQMNGYRSQVFEMHTLPGGVCTGWKRKGYTFDGCMHHLVGCDPKSRIHRMWRELGVMPRPVHFPDDLIGIENTEGQRFILYTDLDRLENHMRELAPADGKVIGEFVDAARKFTRFSMMDMLLAKPWEMVGVLPYLGLLSKWGKLKLEEMGGQFSNLFLRRAISMIQYDFENMPAMMALMFLSGCATRNFGWPAGGSLAFARSIAERYTALDGEIHYRAKVDKILVENDRAVGVRLADGTEHRADTVISNADGRTTIFDMLQGRYTTELIRTYYANPPQQQEMALHVSFGVARDFSIEPHTLVLWLPEPVEIAGRTCDRLDIEFFNFAPEMSPPGKTAMQVVMTTSYDYWKALSPEDYRAEKARVAETLSACLERRFPGFAAQVEVTDVATPLTTGRFTGSFMGYQAWGVPNQSMLDALTGKGLSKTLPGLSNFYMVGQWAGGLGLPNVAAMGRKAIAGLCKQDGRQFVAEGK